VPSDTSKIVNQNFFTKPPSIVSFNDKYKIGLYFGCGISNYTLKQNNIDQSIYKDSVNSVSKSNKFVTEFGIYLEYRISNRLALKTKLEMVFDRVLLKYDKKTETENLDLLISSIAIPIHLIAQTKGENVRFYAL